ncbi:hypothetical protein HK102_013961 [Quaeritorhiza haematococci]|nr:hypothetical protein HK102_013961 [Quaeritorhiza haematococci]
MPEPTKDPLLLNLFGSKALHLEPLTGNAALQHLNRLEYADIMLDVKDGGNFFAHRAYLTGSDRFKMYTEKEKFAEGTARVVSIYAPIPNQFYNVLYYVYTREILPSWFAADQLAKTLCTAEYFMLEDVKKEAIGRFPSLWKAAIASSFFAPKWIPVEILSELVALKGIQAAIKIRIIGTWFRNGDDLSPDAHLSDMVLSNCTVDESMTPKSIRHLRMELGKLVFNRVVPGSYLADVYDKALNQIKAENDKNIARIKSGYDNLKLWMCRCGHVYAYYSQQAFHRKCPACNEIYSTNKEVTDIHPLADL